MSRVLVRFFNNGLVVVVTAVLAGLFSMAVLYFIVTNIWEDKPIESPPQEALAVPETERPAETLESYFLSEDKIALPFLSRDDGSVLGFVFLDVTIEVKGEEAYSRGAQAWDNIKHTFEAALDEEGIGKANQPGIVDYERLAQTLLGIAGEEIGPDYIAEVRVTGTDED